ncbi:MAG: ATP-dependent DNA helicase RecG [Tannerellaceae bacterium]|nr:ATP-dependent DNA helicase RecG [Tannerellaceae bacterium]
MITSFNLSDSLTYVPGVGPRKATLLQRELSISSVHDLLFFFPFKYIDRTRFYSVAELSPELPYVQLRGHILDFQIIGASRNKRLVASFRDETASTTLVWFHNIHYILSKYKPNTEYILFGKPNEFNHSISIPHPDLDLPAHATHLTGKLVPLYHSSDAMKKAGLASRNIQDIIRTLLQAIPAFHETLTQHLLHTHQLIPRDQAIRYIHFPPSAELLHDAQTRLKFEELFFLQLNLLRHASLRKHALPGIPLPKVGDHFNSFYHNHLPFSLTDAQKRVTREIHSDLRAHHPMNRLLQGDVGSGKTIVALLTALLAIDNGHQAAIMAPTEILATQHFETLSHLLAPLNLNIALLTGSTPPASRKKLLPLIASGHIHILVGTHALIQSPVSFHSLALAIIDEQHRFGVAQRALLHTKNHTPPHILVMTATPIPRTLAMTLYGDLDLSVIDELPPGRKPIKTVHRYDSGKAKLFDFLRAQIQEGRQAYVVFPLIQESEKADFKNLQDGLALYQELFPHYRILMLHGKMKPNDKNAVMAEFIAGSAHILLATTVIEVGVNVPNASVMIIESAERFGLAQLHQLRGRVGRGADQSYCLLITGGKLSDDSRRRIDIMTATNDGFQIAEADLRLRGHGDLEGTQQSGQPIDLRIANLATDAPLLHQARQAAALILTDDPHLSQNSLLAQHLQLLFTHKPNFTHIS